jgi:hypothetical protein
MAHAQKPDFVFRRNGLVNSNRQGLQFSRLLAAEVGVSAVVMLGTPSSEVVWRVLATHPIRHFSLYFPSRASPCAITFQLDFTSGYCVMWPNEPSLSQAASFLKFPDRTQLDTIHNTQSRKCKVFFLTYFSDITSQVVTTFYSRQWIISKEEVSSNNIAKILINFFMSLRPSIHMGKTGNPLDGFSRNLDIWIFSKKKTHKNKHFSFKSMKHNRYFKWRPIYIFNNISLSSS